jgi:thiol:disulfide interchange protein
VRDEVLRGQVALVAMFVGGCGGPSAPQPATVDLATAGSAAVLVAPSPPRPVASAKSAEAGPIQWITNEREARERARRQGLPLLVWVRADWAATALQMERTTWADPRVARAAGGFVALRLDLTDTEGDGELLAQRYGVDTMPATIVFDPSGRQIAIVRGFADADALVAALSRAAP